MNTTCDLSVDWNRCAYCSELRDRVQSASDLRLACSQRLDQAWEEYRAERERGNVAFGTATHRAWQARIDNLDRQLLAADAAVGEAIDEWADCIHEHHRLHEARQQEAADSSKDVAAETEEMVTISKAEAVDELVNIYGGHIDKWLEALRERTGAQTDAGDDTEAAEKEDETARELFGELRYGDVPDFDLPDDFEDGSWVSLHSASVAVRVYMILLERYAPRAAKGYPAWVANRLRDVLDEAAIQRAITDQEGRK